MLLFHLWLLESSPSLHISAKHCTVSECKRQISIFFKALGNRIHHFYLVISLYSPSQWRRASPIHRSSGLHSHPTSGLPVLQALVEVVCPRADTVPESCSIHKASRITPPRSKACSLFCMLK